MTYNPEHDALIIREHARLREIILTLPAFRLDERVVIRREHVLGLLHNVEPDTYHD